MRVTVIHNPKAGDSSDSGSELMALLAAAGHAATYHTQDDLAPGLQDPGDLVVVAGGDGTVKQVALALAGRRVPMAVLPLGTANNIAKSLGIGGHAAELVPAWADAPHRRVDVGVLRTASGEGLFLESVGGGLLARLVARGRVEIDINPNVPTHAELDHALLLVHRLLDDAPAPRWELALDGTDASGEYLLVEAMNMPLVGPNIPLAPDADPGDGLLDVVTVTADHRDEFITYIARRLAGDHSPPSFPVLRGERLRMVAPACEFHADDRSWLHPAGHHTFGTLTWGTEGTRAEVTLERSAVEFVIPVSAHAGA